MYVVGVQGIDNPHGNIHIQNAPLPFKTLLQASTSQPGSQLVINQDGIGTSSLALLAGVPQLPLPDMAEAFIIARTLVPQGETELLRPEASRELLIQTLGRMINGAHYRERAAVLAQQK